MGRAEHISGEGSQRGDRHLDGIEAEEVSGSDPQFLEQPPPTDIVGGCVGDWWTPVEGGEHRQRLGIGLQQSGEWAARAADGNESGAERRIVGEEFGGLGVGGDDPLQRTAACRWRGRALDRLVESDHPQSVPTTSGRAPPGVPPGSAGVDPPRPPCGRGEFRHRGSRRGSHRTPRAARPCAPDG